MVTEEYNKEKTCLFCANDYHLEMILLPFIKERLDKFKIIIYDHRKAQSVTLLLKNRQKRPRRSR